MSRERPTASVSLGIVTCNSAKDLPSCAEGISNQTSPISEIIIIDNGSTDNSLAIARASFPDARIIINEQNTGYCVAHNFAISETSGKYYLALNPDVNMAPDFISNLVRALEDHPECGAAVGKFRLPGDHEPRLLDAAGLGIDRRRHQYLRGHGEPDQGQFDQAGDVFGADGAAPLYRRQTLEELQIFGQVYDEAFFSYMEDVDLAWRARLFGWTCWYEPAATAIHDRTFKPGRRRQMPKELRKTSIKNRYLTILKNEDFECWRRDWWRILYYDIRILAYVLLLEKSSLGAYGMLRSQWGRAREWRREIQSRARVNEEQRLSWFD